MAPGQNTIEFAGNDLKPPVDGWITRFEPSLTYADGKVPRVDVVHLSDERPVCDEPHDPQPTPTPADV